MIRKLPEEELYFAAVRKKYGMTELPRRLPKVPWYKRLWRRLFA